MGDDGPAGSQLASYQSVTHLDGDHPLNSHGEDHVDIEDHDCDHWCGHGHGHHDFDYLQPFHHRHETQCGYPIFEMLRTDHAFIDRKIRADFANSAHAGDGKTLMGTCDWQCFNYLTPLIELNGITSLNGDESGAKVIDLTP
jgi:hypothetical protein|tara:strand:+ start:3224 stop:3649 length:426 start_codon:yes stop_codon:yes gene_type:complete